MSEKRHTPRYHHRMSVRYGEESCNRIAFADNFTEEGIFLRTAMVQVPGSAIQLTMNIPTGDVIALGRVAWARRIPPHMLRLVKNAGMGIRILKFLDGEDRFREYCASLRH